MQALTMPLHHDTFIFVVVYFYNAVYCTLTGYNTLDTNGKRTAAVS